MKYIKHLSFTLLLIFSFCVSFTSLHAQEKITLKAYTYDRFSQEALAYVEIGFVNRDTGVISDENGFFDLNFLKENFNTQDTLQFQLTGYYPIRLPYSKIKEVFSKNPIIYLNKIPDSKKKPYAVKAAGETSNSDFSGNQFWKTSSTSGQEIITRLKNTNQNKPEALSFYSELKNADSLKVRIKIYNDFEKNGNNTFNYDPIYFTVRKSGWQNIDLTNIKIRENQEYFIGIQPVNSYNKEFSLNIGLSAKTNSFETKNSHGKLVEFPFNGVAMYTNSDREGKIVEPDNLTNKIRGTITQNGEPVQGAKIEVSGKLKEVESKSDGSFSIEAKKEEVLKISYLAAEPKQLKINDNNPLEIELKDKYEFLNAVKLTGKKKIDNPLEKKIPTPFGNQSKRSLGYAVYSKDVEDLNQSAISLGELVQSRFPGITVQRSDTTGLDYIYLRGGNKSMGAGRALVVVDGVPDQLAGNNLSVFDVQRVTVIPGLTGVARFGQRARGGVILVTTKKAEYLELLDKKNRVENLIFNDGYNRDAISLNQAYSTINSTFDLAPNLDDDTAIIEYERLKQQNRYSIPFYLNSFDFFKKRKPVFAKTILDTLKFVAQNNVKALRTLAYKYEQNEYFHEATEIYQQIGSLRPHAVQSYLDLAQSYTNIKLYSKSAELYELILANRIPGLQSDETSREHAEIRLKHILTKYESFLNLNNFNPKYYQNDQLIGALIIAQWNDNQASFEIQYIDSNDKFFTSSHTLESDIERLQLENKIGYYSEITTLEGKFNDSWSINLKSKENHPGEALNPNFVKFTIYRNFGSTKESKQIEVLNLNDLKKNIQIAEIDFNY